MIQSVNYCTKCALSNPPKKCVLRDKYKDLPPTSMHVLQDKITI